MSLINQMLQDLEKRHASGAERGALPNQVRVLPRAQQSAMPWRILAGLATGIVIAALAWQFLREPGRVPAEAAARVVPAAPPAQAVPATAPASRMAMDLEYAPVPDAGRTHAAAGVVSPGGKAAAATAPPPSPPVATAPTLREVVAVQAPAKSRPADPAPAPSAPAFVAEKVAPRPAAPVAPKAEAVKAVQTHVEVVKLVASVPPVLAVTASSGRPATVGKVSDMPVETKVQQALAYPQIDKRAQQLTPQQHAENDYRDAVNFLNQGRLAEAQEGFRRALRSYPGHTGARQGLFGLLVEAQKSGEAEQVLTEGLKLNPNQPGFAMALARLQVDRGNTAGAVETMQKAAAAGAASPDYLAFLAALLQRQSRHADAVEQYRAALRLAPGSGVWQMGLAISLQALNRNAEAQDAFRNAKATNTLNPELQAFVDQRLRQLQ